LKKRFPQAISFVNKIERASDKTGAFLKSVKRRVSEIWRIHLARERKDQCGIKPQNTQLLQRATSKKVKKTGSR